MDSIQMEQLSVVRTHEYLLRDSWFNTTTSIPMMMNQQTQII